MGRLAADAWAVSRRLRGNFWTTFLSSCTDLQPSWAHSRSTIGPHWLHCKAARGCSRADLDFFYVDCWPMSGRCLIDFLINAWATLDRPSVPSRLHCTWPPGCLRVACRPVLGPTGGRYIISSVSNLGWPCADLGVSFWPLARRRPFGCQSNVAQSGVGLCKLLVGFWLIVGW